MITQQLISPGNPIPGMSGVMGAEPGLAHPDGRSLHLHLGRAVRCEVRDSNSDMDAADQVCEARRCRILRVSGIHGAKNEPGLHPQSHT